MTEAETSAPAGPSPRRPSSEGRRRRARRGEGELLRDEILDATERLLVETGDPAGVSIRAVASAVGVTPPSIYLHFADKDELIYATCDRVFALLASTMQADMADAGTPLEALRAMGKAYVRFGLENPEQYRIIFMNREETEPDWVTPEHLADLTAFGELLSTVQLAIDSGAIRNTDPLQVAFTLWASTHGLTSLLISKPSFPWGDRDAVVDHLLATLVDGLRPTAEG